MLQIDQINVSIGTTNVCQNFTFNLEPRHCAVILGCNGVGKSTLLRSLAGLHPLQSGSIRLNGKNIREFTPRERASNISILFQHYDDVFPITVYEYVRLGCSTKHVAWLGDEEADAQQVAAALAAVDLAGYESRLLSTLSGGERRRVGLALLLCQDTPILLLDEPSNHLDIRHQVELLTLLRTVAITRGKIILSVMHDINLAARFNDFAWLILGNGQSQFGPVGSVMTETNLTALYRYPIRQIADETYRLYTPSVANDLKQNH